MKFAEPSWLIAGFLVIAGLVFVYRLLDARQRAALAEFASSHLLAKLTASFSPGRRMLKRGLFLAAIACIFVALARPQWGFHWVDQKERGIDLLFAIDTSKSMLTQDVNPDRLTRAKMAITDFVRKLDGDRVGLIAFAGEGFLQAPLTLDYDAFQDSLDSIDTNTIPRGGTDISSAIQEAQAAFANEGDNKKILILVTDGEDLQGQGIDAARAAAKDGMVIYTVGVGTAAGGLIPVPNGNGSTDFVKDPSTGEYVKSHLDENTLTQIAQATGGMYQPLGQQGQGLGVIYDKAIASMPKHDLAARRTRVYEERYQWPLSAGLVLLLASMLIGTRRRTAAQGSKASAKPAARVRRAKGVAAAVLALLAIPALAHASAQSAESDYKKGNYSKAETQYQDAAAQHPDNAPLQYDLGAAAYKTGEFDTAL
ncbi:MAG TPA: VWA domain-containing protein, partial [Candidatus Methylacidiphilales bacterium]|nr:VWA domain-containing protein [Candidatus Methylacidiphilales bacterium]